MIVFLILSGILVLSIGVFIAYKVVDKLGDKYSHLEYECDIKIYELKKCIGSLDEGPDPKGHWEAEKEIDALKLEETGIKNKKLKCWNISRNLSTDSIFGLISLCLLILSSVILLVCSIVCIANHAPRVVEKNMTELNIERESLVYRLESQQEIGNEYLYNDIVEFNKTIYDYTYDHNNPWISWFVPEEYGTIEMIEYKK